MPVPKMVSERLAEAEALHVQFAAALYGVQVRREQLAAEERQLLAQVARAEGAVSVLRDLAAEERASKAPPIAGSSDPAPAVASGG